MENKFNLHFENLDEIEEAKVIELIKNLGKLAKEVKEVGDDLKKYASEFNAYKFRLATDRYRDLNEAIKKIHDEFYVMGIYEQDFYEAHLKQYNETKESVERCYKAAELIEENCKNFGKLLNIFKNPGEEL